VYAGLYKVKVTEANGCTTIDTITLTEPLVIVPVIDKVYFHSFNTSCFGVCDGKIWLDSIKGGTPGFDTLWTGSNGPPPIPTDTLRNQCAGEVALHITDANDCVLDTTAT